MGVTVRARRLAVRSAYVALRVYWFIARPQMTGVKCVLTDDDYVLLVRHTYGRRHWELPGGTLRRREAPINAARREMREELGRSIEDWVPHGEVFTSSDHHRDVMHVFQATVPDRRLEIDLSELSAAEWFPLDELPAELGRSVPTILKRIDPRRGERRCRGT